MQVLKHYLKEKERKKEKCAPFKSFLETFLKSLFYMVWCIDNNLNVEKPMYQVDTRTKRYVNLLSCQDLDNGSLLKYFAGINVNDKEKLKVQVGTRGEKERKKK